MTKSNESRNIWRIYRSQAEAEAALPAVAAEMGVRYEL